jgi:hypothetical protein
MANTLLIFTEEGVKRIVAGLGELPSKLAHELLNDIDFQLNMLKTDVKKYVATVEEHLTPHKAIAATKSEVAAVEKVAEDIKAAV